MTRTQELLLGLAPAGSKIPVAVYGFADKTGQFKPTDAGQTLSRAVSQGADAILVKALQDAGDRSWFTVIERGSLNNLLKERQIISEMRQRYLGEARVNPQALPPLLFAGVLLEGGIVGFDTNIQTGGAAARYLGVGGQTDYRQNVVSVYLRAVSVKTGEVMASVTTEKSIASIGVAGNAFRFVTFDNILEADVGYTSNEPGLLALRQAIEKSVYALIMEGAEIGLWSFQDRRLGAQYLQEYRRERAGVFDVSANAAATRQAAASANEKQRRGLFSRIFSPKKALRTSNPVESKSQGAAQPTASGRSVQTGSPNGVSRVNASNKGPPRQPVQQRAPTQ
ncbi:MAG: CsgG/HfaB family protein [Pseudomonadota bacterium]